MCSRRVLDRKTKQAVVQSQEWHDPIRNITLTIEGRSNHKHTCKKNRENIDVCRIMQHLLNPFTLPSNIYRKVHVKWVRQDREGQQMLVLHSQRSKEQRDEEVTDVFDLSVEPVCHRVCIIHHHSASLWRSMCGQFRCCNKCNLEVLRLSRWSWQGCLLSKLQRETKGYQIWFQKQTPVLCIGALRSTYFIRFIILLLCCETCWIQLRCSALYGNVARATPAIKAASSIPTPTCTQYYTVTSQACSNIDLSAITLSKLMLATLCHIFVFGPSLAHQSRILDCHCGCVELCKPFELNTQGRCAVTPLEGVWALNNIKQLESVMMLVQPSVDIPDISRISVSSSARGQLQFLRTSLHQYPNALPLQTRDKVIQLELCLKLAVSELSVRACELAKCHA